MPASGQGILPWALLNGCVVGWNLQFHHRLFDRRATGSSSCLAILLLLLELFGLLVLMLSFSCATASSRLAWAAVQMQPAVLQGLACWSASSVQGGLNALLQFLQLPQGLPILSTRVLRAWKK